MWKILKKYRFVILFVFPIVFSSATITTGCNPHRPGATVRPMGGGAKKRYHTKTASSKARKKRKY